MWTSNEHKGRPAAFGYEATREAAMAAGFVKSWRREELARIPSSALRYQCDDRRGGRDRAALDANRSDFGWPFRA
jgi:hypothetical protein